MINSILSAGFDSIENPESIATIVVASVATIIGAILKIIQKKTKKPESVEKNLDKVNGILKTFSSAMTELTKSLTKKKEVEDKQKKVDAKKGA